MKVYLDTSVIMRIILCDANALPTWGQWTSAYSSRLWEVEARRCIDRARLCNNIDDQQVAQLRIHIDLLVEHIQTMPLTEAVLSRAGDAFPTVIATLDAIHLATALAIRNQFGLDAFLTHDTQLATAAAAMGFVVQGI